ncbi:hypothetical protein BJX70DRAFT_399900 [Aspergillus crustosus]
MYNVVTWDHKPPSHFRAAAQDNIGARYDTIRFKAATIVSVVKNEDGTFEVVDEEDNKYQGKRLALATGVTDLLPDITGFKELWGKLIFHCLFFHDFEERGAVSAGVLAAGFLTQPAMILHMARMATPLAKKVTVYCHGNEELTSQVLKEFEGKPLSFEPRRVTAVKKLGERVTVHFEDGETREEGFLVSVPPVKINGPFHKQLGLDVDPMGFIKTNPPFNETSVSGVFAVGDCASMVKATTQAIAMGSFGAAGLVAQLASMGKF